MEQKTLYKTKERAYGGELFKSRKGRLKPRPVDTKNAMHLVLRSSRATGDMSFLRKKNKEAIELIVAKFSDRYGIKIKSLVNVGNHLHFHVQIKKSSNYTPFIRAVTSAIAMAIAGKNRWTRSGQKREKFWDHRPFTRTIVSRGTLGEKDFQQINELEGIKKSKVQAKAMLSRRV